MIKDKEVEKTLHLPTYFDFSAATPVHPRVLEAMMPYFSECFTNPSALYESARGSKKALEDARSDVASAIGAKPAEIVFTAGGSESIALAIDGVMSSPWNTDAIIAISAIEHDAVRHTAARYNREIIGVDQHGVVMIEELEDVLRQNDHVALVSVIYASNEIGTVQHITDISKAIKKSNQMKKKQGLPETLFHIDASQAPLYLDCNPSRLGVDLMTLNGGKMYAPKQSGILYVRSGLELEPILRGGGQEFGMRSGTENVANAVGFAKAVTMAHKARDERVATTVRTRDYLMNKLEEIGGTIYGHRTKRNANNVLVGFDGADNEVLVIKLDMLGFCVAIGSACHASSGEPSQVLKSIGLKPHEAQSTLRLSINDFTTKEDCDKLVVAISRSL